jgi:bacterioferritin (cytochrome b1)
VARDRAEEARMHADEMKDPETKHVMLRIADGHERQAQLLEKKLRTLKTQLKGVRTDALEKWYGTGS